MINRAYVPSTLRRYIRKSDFQRHAWLRDNDALIKLLEDTAIRVNSDEAFSVPMSIASKRGKATYTVSLFSDELVLRKASHEVSLLRSGPVFSRELIVASLRSLLEDAIPHRIYRFDIKSFFESVEPSSLLSALELELASSPVTIKLIRGLLKSSYEKGCSGVPRGVGLSNSLAEYSLSEFDRTFAKDDKFFFYGRYVDDIILLAEAQLKRADVVAKMTERLPSGMQLNSSRSKRAVIESPRADKESRLNHAGEALTSDFSYLGYRFSISNVGLSSLGEERKNCFRRVSLDIADEKVKKIKTRLVLSSIDFLRTSDFDLLLARVKFLTSNYSLPEKTKRHKRLGGIYYNYPMISLEKSSGLDRLDKFLAKMVLSGQGNIFSKLSTKLTMPQRRELLSYSFRAGFKSRRILHFSPKLIHRIVDCWQAT